MKFSVSTLALSVFAYAAVLPSSSSVLAKNSISDIKGNEKDGVFDVNKPAAIITAEAMRAVINTALLGTTAFSMAQSAAESMGSVVGQPKPIN
ncbi:hypothetical protein DSO57_1001669 [Entomophthora muscae]|uniref:Uncharacterized protein n=2 Tax=Entomophthora muscae TaxID=34485 RepID=A0ACC2TWK0_9FUNG|nr:hypothetical protein DSO57_1021655 [Entomophthora muscae]KAJ9078918.1 hypothetical protein DSO57_1001669 [Entomophthora muscae]